MNNRFNQRQYALNRIAEKGNISPYSQEYVNSLLPENPQDDMNTDVHHAQFTNPLPEYGYGQYQMGNPNDVDMSALNSVTAPQLPPQLEEAPKPLDIPQKPELEALKTVAKPEEEKRKKSWYETPFPSIRQKIERGW